MSTESPCALGARHVGKDHPLTKSKRIPASSPQLDIEITEEQRRVAIESNSGGCLIADAIKKQYPHLTGVTSDMATIRVTDRAKGLRYTYLTPAAAQHVLLAFDQGWPNPTDTLRIRRAVKITPITRSVRPRSKHNIARLERLEHEGKQLTADQKRALSISRTAAKKRQDRPASTGPAEVHVDSSGAAVVVGGPPIPQGPAHPNLLRGRDRHFGAKLADPGRAFHDAVEQAVAERLASEPLAT